MRAIYILVRKQYKPTKFWRDWNKHWAGVESLNPMASTATDLDFTVAGLDRLVTSLLVCLKIFRHEHDIIVLA